MQKGVLLELMVANKESLEMWGSGEALTTATTR